MAILKKRTSSKQLPEARGLDRAPLGSIIRGVDDTPALTGRGSSSTVNRPTLTTGTSSTPKTSLAPKTSLTTNTSSTPRTSLAPKSTLTSSTTPTTRPTITNKTTTTPTTKTSSPITTTRPTVRPNITNPNSMTSKVVNALTGAAIGAGTKLLVDKITGKPVVKPPAGGTANPPAGGTPRPPAGGTQRPPAGSTAKPPAGGAKPPAVGAKSPTSVVKPPVAPPPANTSSGTGFGDEKEEFTTDSLGNTYKTMPDGTSVLYRAAEVAEDEYMTDSLGNIYKTMPDGTYELYRAAEVEEDIDAYPPNTVGSGEPVNPSFEAEYFEDSLGNIYISTADGGYELYRAAEVDEDIYDETPVVDRQYYDDGYGNIYALNDSGEYELYRAAEVDEDIAEEDYGLFNNNYTDYTDYGYDYDYDYNVNDRYSTEEDDGDEYYDYRRGGLITMMKDGGLPHFDEGGISYQEAFRLPDGAVDNGDGTYTIGRFTYDMMTDEYLYSTDDGQITNVNPDAIYSTDEEEPYYSTDSLGNIFKNGEFFRAAEVPEDIESPGGGTRNWYNDYVRPIVGGGERLAKGALESITGALGTTAGAAGAGALIATLLDQDFSGGTGAQNQGLDMSKVGVINPRTTDFGIGPTNFVGYEDYGTSGGDYTPNEELLRNLNAPGFNPVREGDYGYEEVAAEEPAETPKMASGGLSSMRTPVASYYTFGQPADILANLGMRPQPPMNPPEMMPQIGQMQPPQQAQQQGLPQQMPPQMAQQAPQGMPQQGMMPQQQGMAPPMRKGGLPHVSDVPLTQGRLDFRKGSAVHGPGDGQSDDIPAMLADGEYVIDAETVAQIGNGSTKAGAKALDKFRESIRAHKRSAPVNKIPPKTKALTSYLKG